MVCIPLKLQEKKRDDDYRRYPVIGIGDAVTFLLFTVMIESYYTFSVDGPTDFNDRKIYYYNKSCNVTNLFFFSK